MARDTPWFHCNLSKIKTGKVPTFKSLDMPLNGSLLLWRKLLNYFKNFITINMQTNCFQDPNPYKSMFGYKPLKLVNWLL